MSGGRAALGSGKKVIGGFVWMKINFARLGPERGYFGYRIIALLTSMMMSTTRTRARLGPKRDYFGYLIISSLQHTRISWFCFLI